MDIIGITLTVIFGVLGIVGTYHCWRHNYNEIKKTNAFLQRLNALDFEKEYSLSELTSIIKEADEAGIDISGYFNITESGVLSRNSLMSLCYNMYHNTKNTEKEGPDVTE